MEKEANVRNHLANERTFLSWIRTSLGIMAFGFVVEKFAFFIKKIAMIFAKQPPQESPSTISEGTASIFGILLVGIGALIGLFSFIRYKQSQKEIDENVYHSHDLLVKILTLTILTIGIFLIYYLLNP